MTGVLTLIAASASYALPQGGQVVGGQATLLASGSTLNITQSTDRAIFNWHSFDIASGELVAFHQPSANSVALNRVTGSQSPSQIFGSLTANGTVMLVNPNGVFFSPTAQVNVGSLVATTGDITNERFMAGDHRFDIQGNPNAGIVNQGVITVADAGLVAFVAPNVVNDGVIQATLGKVQLASGDSFTLDLYGDGLLSLEASSAITSQLVSNSGVILANGGKVMLTAAAAEGVVNSLINMDGIIQATSMAERNGEIVIYAEGSNAVKNNITADKGKQQGSSTVLVSGVLDASGRNLGERGGKITVTGDNVALLNGTLIDVSGDIGGGVIKIGGDYHGEGDTPTASHTLVQGNTLTLADALSSGNGGNITVWADDTTYFYGNIFARGGANSGNGGFVETSGKQNLDFQGGVNLLAPEGEAGTLLLDPANIIIATGGAAAYANVNTFAANSGTTQTIAPSTLDAVAGNVVLQATNDITFSNALSLTTLGASLTATANHAINVNAAITTNNGDISLSGITTVAAAINAGAGNITLTDNVNNSSSGGIILNNGGSLTGYDVTLHSNPAASYGAQIRLNSGSQITATNSVTLQDDSTRTDLNGLGYAGVVLNSGATVTTPTLTVQTGGSELTYNGATLNVSGNRTFSGGINFTSNYIIPLTGSTINGNSLTIGSGATLDTQGDDFSFSGITTIAGAINAGAGNITLTDNVNNSSSGGIILNNGGSLTGYDVTLHSNPAASYGAQIRLNSGSQITATNSVTLQDDSTRTDLNGLGYAGVVLNSGATVTTPTLTVQTGGSELTYNGATLNVAGNSAFNNTGAGLISIANALSIGNLTIKDNIAPTLSAAITSTGTVTIEPYTASTTIGVAGGAGALNISTGILGNITASEIDIGRTDGTGALTVNAYTWGESAKLMSGSGLMTIAGAQAMGSNNLTLQTDSDLTLSANLTGTGALTVKPSSAGTTIGLAGGAGTLNLSTTDLGKIQSGFSSITIGNNADTGALIANAYTWNAPLTLYGGSGGISINGAQAMGNNSFLAQTYSTGDITIGASGSVTSSAVANPITLASGRNFINNAGSGALSASSGRWLVYSTNPVSDTIGSLANSFRRFTCAYGGSCPSLGSGNGLLYSYTPTLTATPNALAAITYGDAAPNLAGYSYGLSGYLASDSAADTVTGSLTGSTPYSAGSNVGSYAINYASGSLASTLGYGFSYANNATAISVGQKGITVTAANQTRTYGFGALGTSGFTSSGLYGSDAISGVTLSTDATTSTSGNYIYRASPWTLTPSAAAFSSGSSGNYAISYANATTGLTVNKAALTLTGFAANAKTYDGTTAATISSNGSLSGIAGSDSVSLNSGSASAVFDNKNAGTTHTVTASGYSLGSGNGNLDANNYTLTQPTASNVTISGARIPVLPPTVAVGNQQAQSLPGVQPASIDYETSPTGIPGGNYLADGSSWWYGMIAPSAGSADVVEVNTLDARIWEDYSWWEWVSPASADEQP